MKSIKRYDVQEDWSYTGLVEAGDFYFLNYCSGNLGQPIEDQINGAFDEMERRLALVGLTLDALVKMDCLFRDIWNLPVMEKVIKERFNGKYPARKSIQTEFAQNGGPEGLLFQVDGIAYSKALDISRN
ncbi:RidA family protein [Streptococcus didelphis]|uniref:RidA family protein n=1 Tax=Streptococcus didelphis TaxID=102886 RepID=A0ABY9LFL9_9STRE|nr:Rid family hydrolase [Streptococcus didelphis]WMB27697.1 RidA family protein [Streptococcus didelphis]WMB29846.1 RidA family protein [Streptococcus didelphis]